MIFLSLLIAVLFAGAQYFLLIKTKKALRFTLIFMLATFACFLFIYSNLEREPNYVHELAYISNELIIAMLGITVIVAGTSGCLLGYLGYLIKKKR